MCGTKTSSWAALFTAVGHLVYVRPSAITFSGLSHPNARQLPTVFKSWDVPARHHDEWPKAAGQIYYLESMITPVKQGKRPGLRQLLAHCHGRKATEETDAIFALLSLAGDSSPKDWNIDYKMSAVDVYQEAFANLIRTGSLDIICHASSCGAASHPHSWLPRFGSTTLACRCPAYLRKSFTMSLEEEAQSTSMASNDQFRYSASGNSIASARIEKGLLRLVVKGMSVDQLDVVLERPNWDGFLLTVPQSWLPTEPAQSQPPTMIIRREGWWRTMVADRVISSTYLKANHGRSE